MTIPLADYSRTPTPMPPPPRALCARPGFREIWFARIFMLPHTLIGIGALGFLLFSLLALLFSADVTAQLLRVEAYTSKGKPYYLAHYQYTAGGTTYEEQDGISEERYNEWKTPAQRLAPEIALRQLPASEFHLGPFHTSHLYNASSRWGSFLGILAWCSFWNLIVGAFVFQYWIEPLRKRLLLARGIAVPGRVLSTRKRSGKGDNYFITFSYSDPSGNLHSVEAVCHHKDLWSKARPNEPITVILDPANPSRALPYEYAPYQLKHSSHI